jgi:hypothetical protein
MASIQPDVSSTALLNAEKPNSIAINAEELFKKWRLAFFQKKPTVSLILGATTN